MKNDRQNGLKITETFHIEAPKAKCTADDLSCCSQHQQRY